MSSPKKPFLLTACCLAWFFLLGASQQVFATATNRGPQSNPTPGETNTPTPSSDPSTQTRKFCRYQCQRTGSETFTPQISTACRTDNDCARDCRSRCPSQTPPGATCATNPAPSCVEVQVRNPSGDGSGSGGTSGGGSGRGGSGSGSSGGGGNYSLPIDPLGGRRLQEALGSIVRYLLSIVGALLLGAFVYGGVLWMISNGEKDKVKAAQTTLRNALIGLAVVVFAYSLISTLMDVSSRSLQLRVEQPEETPTIADANDDDDEPSNIPGTPSNQPTTDNQQRPTSQQPTDGSACSIPNCQAQCATVCTPLREAMGQCQILCRNRGCPEACAVRDRTACETTCSRYCRDHLPTTYLSRFQTACETACRQSCANAWGSGTSPPPSGDCPIGHIRPSTITAASCASCFNASMRSRASAISSSPSGSELAIETAIATRGEICTTICPSCASETPPTDGTAGNCRTYMNTAIRSGASPLTLSNYQSYLSDARRQNFCR